MRLLPVLLLLLLLTVAAPAAAAPVASVAGGERRDRDDPFLPLQSLGTGGPCSLPTPGAIAQPAAAGPSVPVALRRARLSAGERTELLATYARARRTRAGLAGVRRRELSAAIAGVDDLARRGLLSAARARVVLLGLDRNERWWGAFGPPSATCGGRVDFGDGIVLEWYPSRGLQLQPLATAGRANGVANLCLPPVRRSCDLDAVRTASEGLRALAVERARGYLAWEYHFAFGGGRASWASGMAQATAMQALVKSGRVLGDRSLSRFARRGLKLFELRPPEGVRRPSERGPHFLLYSFAPGLRVYNGLFQTLVGLSDVASFTRDPRAARLFAAGDRQARFETPGADSGSWSRYSVGGRESTLEYHRLVRDFLDRLCERTTAEVYCVTAARFTAYERRRARPR